jgi:hypothetical protein
MCRGMLLLSKGRDTSSSRHAASTVASLYLGECRRTFVPQSMQSLANTLFRLALCASRCNMRHPARHVSLTILSHRYLERKIPRGLWKPCARKVNLMPV